LSFLEATIIIADSEVYCESDGVKNGRFSSIPEKSFVFPLVGIALDRGNYEL
jgi:hypothetical protein